MIETLPIAAAGAIYLGPDNALRLTTFNAAAGVRLTVAGQLLHDDGRIRNVSFDHVPNTDRTAASTTSQVGCGWLINAQVFAAAGTPRRGQCFARLQVTQGLTGALLSIATLLQGYAQDTTALAWPGSPVIASTEGPGCIRQITGTDPAVNTEISETVPTNARWRLLEFRASLLTDATVANRVVVILLDNGTTVFHAVDGNYNHTASLNADYQLFDYGALGVQQNGRVYLPMPSSVILLGGSRIRTSTANLQAGDNWGAPQLLVEEWIED